MHLLNLVKGIGRDSKVGYGLYSDKHIPPYVIPNLENTSNFSYAFENIMSLTSSTEVLNDTVYPISFNTNNDAPEGTIEAMLQVILCNKSIGK